jgi:NADPH2:quinone reductase
LKAVVLREVGGDLAVEELLDPEGAHVLEVRAAGVNFADVLVRHGHYPQMPELPHVLGNEVAGDLDGRRVIAFPRSAGGYAERVEINPDWVLPLPQHASYAAGAAFLTTYLTAHIPLVHQLHITETSVVLVHAGSGGVGTAAIQLAKNVGATVIATASTDEKRAFARTVGADEVRGYDELEGLAVDAVIDPVGGDVFARSLPLLNPLGAIVAIGYVGGAWEDPSVQWLVGRNATVTGFYLGRLLRLRPDVVRTAADELLDLWAERKIDPVVGHRFPLEGAQEAHELIESRRHVGKVVLEP